MLLLLAHHPVHSFALALDLDVAMPSDAFHCVAHFNVEIRAAIELVTVRATDVGLGRVHAPTATTFPCTAFSVTIR